MADAGPSLHSLAFITWLLVMFLLFFGISWGSRKSHMELYDISRDLEYFFAVGHLGLCLIPKLTPM